MRSPLVVLGILFVALRLCDVIKWGWAWVLFPFFVWLAIMFAFEVAKELKK